MLREGKDAVIFAYGPVMLHEALLAGELLEEKGFSLKVVDMPWLNYVDQNWFRKIIGKYEAIFVIDNHFSYGGLGDCLLNALSASQKMRAVKFQKFAIEEYPVCGTPKEVLKYHRLDGESLAERISENIQNC